MSRKKPGLFSSLRNKVFAGIASLLATAGTTVTAVYWNAIVAQLTGESQQTRTDGPGGAGKLPVLSLPKQQPATIKVGLLGCQVTEVEKRVQVAEVPPGSTAAILGLVPGDIIEEIDDHRVETADALSVRLAQSRRLFYSRIEVRRGNQNLRGQISLESDTSLAVHQPLNPR